MGGMAFDLRAAPATRRWEGEIPVAAGADLWVFGYGSLMWNPGFAYAERRAARLHGWRRRFCVWSFRYRGTPDRPGLVLGLDRGGSCRGVAYRVAAADAADVLDYLWEREMISRVYQPRLAPVRVLDDGRMVRACAFTVDRSHDQFCGGLDDDALAARIASCGGERGSNLDYLANTVLHLEREGAPDRGLARLLAAARALAG